jgi:molecular chaperone GrpE (heat shock protein)
MKDRRAPTVPKWPFYAADVVLIVLAIWMVNHFPHPLAAWPATLMALSVAGAAVLGVWPHHMEYEAALKFAQSDGLADTVKEIKNVQAVAEQIRLATGQWQTVQDHSTKTVAAAKEIAERIAAEATAFSEFMQKANDSEKATLRLEVEKLRRSEGQWLQILVHLLDHVFALYQAGGRSGQPNLRDQLGNFQEACRDIVRRVGLTPFEADTDEPFNSEKHQVAEGQPEPGPDACVAETLATGYTFQGQLLRRSLVAIKGQESCGESAAQSADLEESEPVSQSEASADDLQNLELGSAAPVSEGDTTLVMERDFILESDRLTSSNDDLRQA